MSGVRAHLLEAEGGWGSTIKVRGLQSQLLSLGSSLPPGPRGGAAPRKPVSEVPMERDQGAAHSLEPGKESVPGRNQGFSLLPSPAFSALGSQLPCLHPLPPSLVFFFFFFLRGGGDDTGKRRKEDGRVGGKWKPNEEKTQLELISQVSASISAVRKVWGGGTLWHGAEGLDTPGF